MFVYQPKFNTLELKKEKGTDYVLSWKSKGLYTSKLKPLYTAFLHSIKISGYKVGIKFDKDPLTVEQNNLKGCLFRGNSIVKNSDTEKWMYSSHWIAFDGKSMRSFGNDYAKNVIIFGCNNSSCHADNRKSNFLVLDEGDTFDNNGSFGET